MSEEYSSCFNKKKLFVAVRGDANPEIRVEKRKKNNESAKKHRKKRKCEYEQLKLENDKLKEELENLISNRKKEKKQEILLDQLKLKEQEIYSLDNNDRINAMKEYNKIQNLILSNYFRQMLNYTIPIEQKLLSKELKNYKELNFDSDNMNSIMSKIQENKKM